MSKNSENIYEVNGEIFDAVPAATPGCRGCDLLCYDSGCKDAPECTAKLRKDHREIHFKRRDYGVGIPDKKPCPFCGETSTVTLNYRVNYKVVRDTDQWDVSCNADCCRVIGPGRNTKKEAIEAWNKRGK